MRGKKHIRNQRRSQCFGCQKNKEECAKWVREMSTVKNLHTSVNSVICEVHWTSNYATVTLRGKTRPKVPPSVWPGVPTSCIPTPVPKERTILRSLISESYSTWWAEKFREQDTLAFADLRGSTTFRYFFFYYWT